MAFENLKSTGIAYFLTKLKNYFVQIKDAVKSVNGNEPDENGDITVTTVPYAQNLESESSHRSYDTFVQRTTGGDSSVSNGDAWLMNIKGNNTHTGFTEESIEMTVNATGETPITATIDRDTFVGYVSTSGTTTLVYSTDWSADPTLYGITVTGTPVAGDTIVVVYVKEIRGTITVANPQSFVSTGWNLYNHSDGYARVVKYEFGYRIDGTYSSIKFATSPTGTQSDITVNDHNFNIPSDGYVIVTGGNSSDTAIYPVWEDWTDGHTGNFSAYDASTVDLSTVMSTYFPYGLLKAGSVVDELDLNLGQAISRVERMNYTAENLATAKNSGREYEYDENYIYLARATATTSSISVSGAVTANDHGIEYFAGSTVEVDTEILYGNNLKNKLERDVLTISAQSMTDAQLRQVQVNIMRYFGVRPSMYNHSMADMVADINSLSTGIRMYFCDATIGNALAGGTTGGGGFVIISKRSDSWANYFYTYENVMACGVINLGTNGVNIKYTTLPLGVTNQSSQFDDVNVATGTNTALGSISLEKGEYIIIAAVDWASNATGNRQIWFSDSATGSQINLLARTMIQAANGSQTRHQITITYKASSATTIYIVGYQNSGSTLKAQTRYSMARIR